jgi:hypothetical protein
MLKNPVKGKVKTRLAKDVGDATALEIYCKLLEHTKQITEKINVDKFLFYSDFVDRTDLFNNAVYKKYTQCSGTLGDRMRYAFSIPFKNEYKYVVMIGADCYTLQEDHLHDAFEKLKHHDVVIGPALDGGYYLIGMKKFVQCLFENKSWSTNNLLEETKNELTEKNTTYAEIAPLQDIDTIQDIPEALLPMIQKPDATGLTTVYNRQSITHIEP